VRYLNDSAEITLAFDQLSKQIAEQATTADAETAAALHQFGEWIRFRSSGGPMIFATAFTRNGNLLSQWRGYSPHSQGVSFGIDSATLVGLSSTSQFSLGRCRYKADEQSDAISKLVKEVITFARRIGPSAKAHPSQSFHPSFAMCEEAILRVAALIKDARFEEEQEWRIVSRVVSDYVGTNIKYRAGASMLVPYVPVPLKNVDGVIPIDDVIVGPTPHRDAATESIQRCVAGHLQRKHGFRTSYCNIPYRSW
jgi:Protein of unknown function (DUF2971)